MQVIRKPIIEYFSGSESVTHACPSSGSGFGIINDGASNMTVTVGGINMTVKPGERVDDDFNTFNAVIITTTGAYRAWVRG